MTDRQKTIERLAEFAGEIVEKADPLSSQRNPMTKKYLRFGDREMQVSKFRPYEDENHARQVIEKMMEDEPMAKKYITTLLFSLSAEYRDEEDMIIQYTKATLTQRMEAVRSVLDSR